MADAFDWNEEAVSLLRTLWDEGHSTAEIGRRIGVSKGAVTGKARRLKLPAHPLSGVTAGPRIWLPECVAILERDYPRGITNTMIAKRIWNECGIKLTTEAVRKQANSRGLKRPDDYLSEMGRRNALIAKALMQNPERATAVVKIAPRPRSTSVRGQKFPVPVSGFSMLGGTIRR